MATCYFQLCWLSIGWVLAKHWLSIGCGMQGAICLPLAEFESATAWFDVVKFLTVSIGSATPGFFCYNIKVDTTWA